MYIINLFEIQVIVGNNIINFLSFLVLFKNKNPKGKVYFGFKKTLNSVRGVVCESTYQAKTFDIDINISF